MINKIELKILTSWKIQLQITLFFTENVILIVGDVKMRVESIKPHTYLSYVSLSDIMNLMSFYKIIP